MRLSGFIFLGLGVSVLAVTAVIAFATGEPPDRIRGIVFGAILTIAGVVQLVRWRLAVARNSPSQTGA